MTSFLQEGIFYKSNTQIGNSFLLLFLRINPGLKAREIGSAIASLWSRYQLLKKGMVAGLDLDESHRYTGNLSVLLSYGPHLFDLEGLQKPRPQDFDDRWLFVAPNMSGGGSILNDSSIHYGENVNENHALSDEIVLQFIADNEYYTNRVLVETWKELSRLRRENAGTEALSISNYYSGFQRPDGRNWLGFHDGVSNLKSDERLPVISIDSGSVDAKEGWLVNGTYLAFLRMLLNLKTWDNLPDEDQEKIIGRQKLTGCRPEFDNISKGISDSGCPIPGTSEIIDQGNEIFREGRYGTVMKRMGPNPPTKPLSKSHIAQMRPEMGFPASDKRSSRIFRQGFEFLEQMGEYPKFHVGLNFVSFQNTPERLFNTLTYASKTKSPTSLENEVPELRQILIGRLRRYLSCASSKYARTISRRMYILE